MTVDDAERFLLASSRPPFSVNRGTGRRPKPSTTADPSVTQYASVTNRQTDGRRAAAYVALYRRCA